MTSARSLRSRRAPDEGGDMHLSSVREVKASLAGSGEAGSGLDVDAITPFGLPSRRKADVQRIQPSVALGVAPGKELGDYRLAVRVQHLNLLRSSYVRRAVEVARGEADVRLIGHLVKRDDSYQERHRPIEPGSPSATSGSRPGRSGASSSGGGRRSSCRTIMSSPTRTPGSRATTSCSRVMPTGGDDPET
jgi:hypothetical protein